LAGTESDLWIGTLDRGVLDWRGGQTQQFSEAQGLPDARVEAVAIRGDAVYVGTPVGTAELSGDKVARVLAPGRYAHALLPQSDSLLIGEIEGGILSIPITGPAAVPCGAPFDCRARTQIGAERRLRRSILLSNSLPSATICMPFQATGCYAGIRRGAGRGLWATLARC
jgi:hypothetical protein